MSGTPFDLKWNGMISEETMRRKTSAYFFAFQAALPELPFSENYPLWFRERYAEALLFARLAGETPPALFPEWGGVSPFGEGTPSLAQLMDHAEQAAVAFFPTCGEAASKYFRFYFFQGLGEASDHRRFFSFADNDFPNAAFFAVDNDGNPLNAKLDGDSWQLAAALAADVIAEQSPELRRKLALGWMVTGALGAKEEKTRPVRPVKIAGKTLIFQQALSRGRRVMMPSGGGLPEELKRDDVYSVDHLAQAKRLLLGSGFQKRQLKLPGQVEVLHSLVGGTSQAVLLPMLLMAPRKVVLWPSKDTKTQAEDIRAVMEHVAPEMEIRIQTLSSDNMDEAYQAIHSALGKGEDAAGELIAFTGGNRLMGLAAFLAGHDLNRQLVYRDVDQPKDVLTVIQKESGGRYVTDMVSCGIAPQFQKLNWKFLTGRDKAQGLEELLRKVTDSGKGD